VNALHSILWPFLRTTLTASRNCASLLPDWRLLVDLRWRSPIVRPCFNMPLPVTTFCAYRTRRNGPWTDRDHAASKFIKALKEQPVSGWAYVPVRKEHVRLDAANAASAPDIFAEQATHGMKWEEVGPLMLVPIPDSSCTMSTTHPPRTIKMALALLRCIESVDAIVADVLRWSEAMMPAHVGLGTRDPQDLFRRLRLRGPVPADRRVMLIDDVIASGSHVRAAAAFLESAGATIVSAICAARADDSPVIGDAFAIRTVTLESLPVPKQPTA
jgi:hypothetical protein